MPGAIICKAASMCCALSNQRTRAVSLSRLPQAAELCHDQQPAKVDVAKLFAALDIVAMREMALTASHPAAERSWPNREWRAGDPFFNIPESLRADINASWTVPDGFAINGTWLGLAAPEEQPLGSLSRPALFPSAAFPAFDIDDSKNRRGWFGTHLIVELVPMEIRTFEILVERKRSRHWL